MYEKQWDYFRDLNRKGMIAILGLVLTMLLAGVLGAVIHQAFAMIGLIAALIEVCFVAYTTYRIRAFPCPRCTKPYTVLFVFAPNTRGRKCVHCGLRLNEEPDQVVGVVKQHNVKTVGDITV